jgi:fatty-acyl-CoA synthase
VDRLEAAVALDDVINIQYTSGTTGFPKGVMLSSRNIVNNGYWLAHGLGFTSSDRLCLCVPLFHCFGCVIGVLGAFTHAVCPLRNGVVRSPTRAGDGRTRTLHCALWRADDVRRGARGSGIRAIRSQHARTGIMAGALCPETLMRKVIDRMHLPEMTIAYGLT